MLWTSENFTSTFELYDVIVIALSFLYILHSSATKLAITIITVVPPLSRGTREFQKPSRP
jgi:hypothetical protein